MADIDPGFIGVAQFGANFVRCNDFAVNINQDWQFYNHVIGLNDTIPGDATVKDESIGTIQTQRTLIRPNVIDISGPMSFPATIPSLIYFFDKIKYGSYINEFFFNYYCAGGRRYVDSRLSKFGLEISAGEIVELSLDIVSKEVYGWVANRPYQTPEKLITWEKVQVTINDANFASNDLLKTFSLEVSNPIERIYTSEPDNNMDDLAPHDLRIGMQEVSGTVSYYGLDGTNLLPECDTPGVISTIVLTIGAFTTTINVQFLPRKTSGTTGALVSTMGFVGVDKAFGA